MKYEITFTGCYKTGNMVLKKIIESNEPLFPTEILSQLMCTLDQFESICNRNFNIVCNEVKS